jgi:hypothetical protein
MTDPSSTAPVPAQLRVLFFLRAIHYGRVFENVLRELLERGHAIHMALAVEKRGLGPDKTKLFDELAERYAFTYEQLPRRAEPWLRPAVGLRTGIDYLRYLEPEYRDAGPLRDRARDRAPGAIVRLAHFPFRGRLGRRLLGGILRMVESALPIPASLTAVIERERPDVVLVSPLVGLGSIESDAMRAAQAAGLPTVLPVASWDNLTNKGVIREVPTLTVVWNESQVDEAVRLHRLPADRVVAVGAHSFDHWFAWEPATTRAAFAARTGLDLDRPLLLYLGSSFFIAGDETAFVREWVAHVRSDPRLRDAAILLRPHPQNLVGWDKVEDVPGATVVWPRAGAVPHDDERKSDYFDSLFHASAIVGVNTSGLVEAAIVGRPVLTLVSDHFSTQEGTLHFARIAHGTGGEGGVVTVARDWDEHLRQLGDAVAEPEAYAERIERFLSEFVRPGGLDAAAAPAAADAIERAAATKARRVRPRPWLLALLLRAVTPLLPTPPPPRERPERPEPAAPATSADERRAARAEKRRVARRTVPSQADARREAKERARRDKERAKREKAKARAKRHGAVERARKRLRGTEKRVRRRWKNARRGTRRLYNVRYRLLYGRTLALVPARDELPALLNARGLVGSAAEIGVKKGTFSAYLLGNWRGRQLISIDPWRSAAADEYVDRSNVSQDEFEEYYRTAREKLDAFGERSEIWRLTSLEAADRVADGSLDFAYIDARHDYDSVLEDLEAWFPKLRAGGILAGHDYADGQFANGDFGVKSAVDEFFAARGIRVHSTDGPSVVEMFPSWLVEIPRNGSG